MEMSNSYRCLKQQVLEMDGYVLVPLREEDIWPIKEWRNAQIDVLRQKRPLMDEDQRRYYEEIVRPQFALPQPPQILFSYLRDGRCIGYGGLMNIDWDARRAEVSFLLDTSRTHDLDVYCRDFAVFLRMLKHIAFEQLDFHRLFTETYDIRPHHVAVLESNGFVPEGRMRDHVMIRGAYVDSLIHGCLKG